MIYTMNIYFLLLYSVQCTPIIVENLLTHNIVLEVFFLKGPGL